MTTKIALIALLSVFLSALAQLALKIGSTAAWSTGADARETALSWFFKAALANPYVIGGFALYGAGALTWLLVLSRTELSVAYPFVSVGLIVTMLLGAVVLQEPVSPLRLLGGALIVTGVLLVAQS